jgi:phage gp29-like protein
LLHTTAQRVAAAFRALGSLLPRGSERRRDASRLVRPWREDSFHAYPSVGLTPSRLRAFLQAADGGSPQMQFELFAEMLQKWPRLAAVENTRRLALTGLDWEVVPAGDLAGTAEAEQATRAADFCRQTLARIERFREVLDHLAQAIGCGIGLAELVWEDGQLADVVPVPNGRLVADPHEPWRLRVLTEEEPTLGVAIDEYPAKWVVHRPRAAIGRSFEGGLLRASALLYLAQSLSFKDWLIYSQIAGMPVRVAQFEPGTPESDKQRLLKMLESLGTDAVAVFGKNVDLKFIEPTRSGERPYQPLQEYCNTEVTILWLGQHLTTDVRSTGSRAAAEIHDRVREDLLVSDIAEEGRTVRRDLLTPLVESRFGDGVPVPQFRRSLVQSVDTRVLVDTLAVAVNQLGLAVSRQWVHQALGIPLPRGDEPVLSTRSNV